MNKITKTICISVITNTILSIIKIIFGYIFKCSSLVADGIHSFSDLVTDFVALLGNKLSNKPADDDHPFGHGKIEYITSIIISLFILILGFSLLINSYNSEIVIPNMIVIIITIFTIISKYLLSIYVYKVGIENKNNILIASGSESKADVLSSVIVLISIVLMQFSKSLEILKYSDIIATIIISIFIIKTGYIILKNNFNMILETQLDDLEYIKMIKEIILSEKEVINIRDLYILTNGPYYKLISNVNMTPNITLKHAHDVIEKIENKLKKYDEKIKYIFIHMEPNEKNEL